jgi:predicted ATPase
MNSPSIAGRGSAFLRRIRLRNYKSIAQCDVEFAPLTVLVGRNGAGKSNVLDALRFVSDSLQSSLDHAIKERGGIDAVRRKSTGHPRNFAINLSFWLAERRQEGYYGFEIAARSRGGFAVKWEKLVLGNVGGKIAPPSRAETDAQVPLLPANELGHTNDGYEIEDGQIKRTSVHTMPPVAADRLYLVNAAGLPAFRPAYDALTAMGFYNLVPEVIKGVQSPDAGELLRRDGSNLASVIARLAREDTPAHERIESYLEQIVPGIVGFERVPLGPLETLLFHQKVHGAEHPWKFYATNISDGTLRALGVLVAVHQIAQGQHPATFVGIEEPETALHPAATGALMDALRAASRRTQIALTCHSPDLLDHIDIEHDALLVVQNEEGTTRLAAMDPGSAQAIRQHLYSPGELLRLDQLEPDKEAFARQEQTEFWPGERA